MRILALFITLALAGCAASPRIDNSAAQAKLAAMGSQHAAPKPEIVIDPSKIDPVNLTAKQRKAVERAVASTLKDPYSARFGNMNANRGEAGLITVCGWVNAKNSYGGYVGESPFTATYIPSSGGVTLVTVAGPKEYELVKETCLRSGVPLIAY